MWLKHSFVSSRPTLEWSWLNSNVLFAPRQPFAVSPPLIGEATSWILIFPSHVVVALRRKSEWARRMRRLLMVPPPPPNFGAYWWSNAAKSNCREARRSSRPTSITTTKKTPMIFKAIPTTAGGKMKKLMSKWSQIFFFFNELDQRAWDKQCSSCGGIIPGCWDTPGCDENPCRSTRCNPWCLSIDPLFEYIHPQFIPYAEHGDGGGYLYGGGGLDRHQSFKPMFPSMASQWGYLPSHQILRLALGEGIQTRQSLVVNVGGRRRRMSHRRHVIWGDVEVRWKYIFDTNKWK